MGCVNSKGGEVKALDEAEEPLPSSNHSTRGPAHAWLRELGLPQYTKALEDAGFSDWELLSCLTEADLDAVTAHTGTVIPPGHRKKLLLASRQMGRMGPTHGGSHGGLSGLFGTGRRYSHTSNPGGGNSSRGGVGSALAAAVSGALERKSWGRRPSSSAAPRTSSRAPSHTGSRGTDDEQSTPSHGHGLQAAGRRSKLGLLVPSRHSSHGTLPVGGVGPPPQQQPDDAGPAPMLGYIASPSAAASLTRGRSGGAGAGRHWAADRTEALRTGTDGGARGGTSVGVGGACAVTPRSPSSPAAGRARLCEACGGALGAGATEGGAAGVARQRRRWSNTNNNTGSSKLGVRQCACGGKARGHRSAVGGDGRLGAGTPAAGGVRTLSSGSLGWPEGAEEGGRHGGAGDNATVVSPRTTGAEQTFMDDLRQLSTTSSLAPPPGPLGQPAPPHLWAAGAAEGTPVAAAALGGLPRTGSATGRDLEFLVVGAQGPLSHHPSSTLSRNQSLAARPDRLHGQSGGGSRTSFEHSMEHPWPGEDHAHPHAFARRASGLGPHGRPHAALQINVLGLQPHGGSGSPRAPSSSRGGSHGGLQGPTSPLVLRGLGSGTPRALGSPQGGGGRGSPYPLSQGAGAGGGGGAIVPADSTLRSWAHIPHPPSHALSHVSSGVPVAWGDGADGLSTVDEVRAAGGALSPPRAAGKDSAKQRGGKLSAGSGGPSAGGAAAEVPSSPSHAAGGGALPRFVRALAGWAGGGGGEAVSEGGAGAGSPGGGRGNAKDQQQQQQQKVVGLQKVLRERLSSPGIGTAAGARAGTAVPLANVTEDAASGSPFYGSKAAPRSARSHQSVLQLFPDSSPDGAPAGADAWDQGAVLCVSGRGYRPATTAGTGGGEPGRMPRVGNAGDTAGWPFVVPQLPRVSHTDVSPGSGGGGKGPDGLRRLAPLAEQQQEPHSPPGGRLEPPPMSRCATPPRGLDSRTSQLLGSEASTANNRPSHTVLLHSSRPPDWHAATGTSNSSMRTGGAHDTDGYDTDMSELDEQLRRDAEEAEAGYVVGHGGRGHRRTREEVAAAAAAAAAQWPVLPLQPPSRTRTGQGHVLSGRSNGGAMEQLSAEAPGPSRSGGPPPSHPTDIGEAPPRTGSGSKAVRGVKPPPLTSLVGAAAGNEVLSGRGRQGALAQAGGGGGVLSSPPRPTPGRQLDLEALADQVSRIMSHLQGITGGDGTGAGAGSTGGDVDGVMPAGGQRRRGREREQEMARGASAGGEDGSEGSRMEAMERTRLELQQLHRDLVGRVATMRGEAGQGQGPDGDGPAALADPPRTPGRRSEGGRTGGGWAAIAADGDGPDGVNPTATAAAVAEVEGRIRAKLAELAEMTRGSLGGGLAARPDGDGGDSAKSRPGNGSPLSDAVTAAAVAAAAPSGAPGDLGAMAARKRQLLVAEGVLLVGRGSSGEVNGGSGGEGRPALEAALQAEVMSVLGARKRRVKAGSRGGEGGGGHSGGGGGDGGSVLASQSEALRAELLAIEERVRARVGAKD